MIRSAARLAACSVFFAASAVTLAGCSEGMRTRPPADDGGMMMSEIDGGGLRPDCGEGFADCPTGFVCAAVMGVPRCVPDPERPPPGDGTDCRPCPAPGECRMGVCVQPSMSGGVCEFDSACPMGQLCIAGRCTPDPRIPIPCTDSSMCPGGTACGPDGFCHCATTSDCPVGLECRDGSCVPGPGGDSCVADDECPAGYICEAGRCRERTICDITNPNLAGTWSMVSNLHLREALPGWLDSFLATVEEPFRFLAGDSTCIDWDGLPGWVDMAICDLVRPYVDRYLPPWSRPVFRAVADLNDVLNTWHIEERMELTAGGVPDSYRGTHTWLAVEFMYRDMVVRGDPATILDWRFSPSPFNATATCGQFNIDRHAINVSIGSIISWLVDAIIYEASDHMWRSLEHALTSVASGFCRGLADAAEASVDYPGVGGSVMSICTGLVSTGIRAAVDAVRNARVGADAITLRGTSPIAGPSSLTPGVWDGTLLGRGFSGDFDARR